MVNGTPRLPELERRLAQQGQILEQYVREQVKLTEENATQRSQEHLATRISSLATELRAEVIAVTEDLRRLAETSCAVEQRLSRLEEQEADRAHNEATLRENHAKAARESAEQSLAMQTVMNQMQDEVGEREARQSKVNEELRSAMQSLRQSHAESQEYLQKAIESAERRCEKCEAQLSTAIDSSARMEESVRAVEEDFGRKACEMAERVEAMRRQLHEQVHVLASRIDAGETSLTTFRAQSEAATSAAIVGVATSLESKLQASHKDCHRTTQAAVHDAASTLRITLRAELQAGLDSAQALLERTLRDEKERSALSWHYMNVAAQALGRQSPRAESIGVPSTRAATPYLAGSGPSDVQPLQGTTAAK